jgi:hypothetical protein
MSFNQASLKNIFPFSILFAAGNGNSITRDRKRTNILRGVEQPVLEFLCRIMPPWVTSNMLTLIGFAGSLVVASGFLLAHINRYYLALSVFGFAIQWFGDSLDGRIAYYRNTPRKWYGFSLDLSVDWLSTMLIGLGFYFYLPEGYSLLAFGFVTIYGWAMLLALLKYRVTDKYAVDTGLFGPTEFRISLCLVLVAELIFPGALLVAASVVIVILSVVCTVNFKRVLDLGDARDKAEKKNLPANQSGVKV